IRRKAGNRGGTFTLNGLLKVMGTDTAIAMSAVNLNGTVEYAMNGAQNFIMNGGDGAVVPNPYNNLIITGSGTKTLAINATVNGTLTRSGTASLALSTFALSYGSSSTLVYGGTTSQTTANTEWPASNGPRNVVINNANGVTLNSGKTTAGNLTLLSGTLALGSNALNIQGTTFIAGGAYTGGTGYTDGYDDLLNNYFTIAANDINMTNFSGSSAYSANWPYKVNRNWVISASFSGAKALTLYWTAAEDLNYDWVGLSVLPSAYLGATEITPIGYNVSSDPRYVTISVSSFGAKGTFQVGPADDQTLPIELSSFTAIPHAQNYVVLHWVTQSETDVMGYYIYRNTINDVGTAIRVSPLIAATNSSSQTSYQYEDNEVTPGQWYYWLQNIDFNGGDNFHGPVICTLSDGNGGGSVPDLPLITGFEAIYPNPFNPTAKITYNVANASMVSVSVY
ncbi:MAG: hypothetical protein U1C33_01435, partial [Candidatus Cloacimonadaceae bacterium]|nr:hypothetical protein [Candidatus Cloacimonadaceae bacterium]